MCLNSAVSYKAEIALLKKKPKKKPRQRNRHKFLDFQMSDKSCGHSENYIKKEGICHREV